jgi:hypothetical protein
LAACLGSPKIEKHGGNTVSRTPHVRFPNLIVSEPIHAARGQKRRREERKARWRKDSQGKGREKIERAPKAREKKEESRVILKGGGKGLNIFVLGFVHLALLVTQEVESFSMIHG